MGGGIKSKGRAGRRQEKPLLRKGPLTPAEPARLGQAPAWHLFGRGYKCRVGSGAGMQGAEPLA